MYEFAYDNLNKLVSYIHKKLYRATSDRNRYKLNDNIYVWWEKGTILRIFDIEKKRTFYVLDNFGINKKYITNNISDIGNYGFYIDVHESLEEALIATQPKNVIETYKKIGGIENRWFNYLIAQLFSYSTHAGPLSKLQPNYIEDSNDVVSRIKTGILYFVFSGRNAWHSTWVQKYTDGCMHTNLQSAKNYVETKRVQGTVFNIIQLPCLIIESNDLKLYFTEINTSDPLSGYSPQAVTNSPPQGYKLVDNFKDNYLNNREQLCNIILSFNRNSRFWKVKPSANNSIQIFISQNISAYETENIPENLISYRSVSVGKKFKLSWKNNKSNVKSLSIERIYKSYKDNLLNPLF